MIFLKKILYVKKVGQKSFEKSFKYKMISEKIIIWIFFLSSTENFRPLMNGKARNKVEIFLPLQGQQYTANPQLSA